MPPALAPYPEETQGAYQARMKLHVEGFEANWHATHREAERARQKQLWESSAAVALVEVKSRRRGAPTDSPMGNGNPAELNVVAWLKGPAEVEDGARTVTLARSSLVFCGPPAPWLALFGAPGDRFIVFLATDPANQGEASEVMAINEIVELALIQALAAKVR
jgi:hypothetical protein